MMEKNEEEMKEVKEEMKEVKKEIAKVRRKLTIIEDILGRYSSDQWDGLKSSPTFRQQVEREFDQFSSYSFDELKQEKMILEERQNKLLDKENLLLQKSLQGIKPFHFFTINDI